MSYVTSVNQPLRSLRESSFEGGSTKAIKYNQMNFVNDFSSHEYFFNTKFIWLILTNYFF